MSKEEIFAIIDDELEKRKLNTFLLWDFPNAVKKRIEELYQSVDNAKPSEALEWFGEQWVEYGIQDTVMQIKNTKEYNAIKQALIKAQEQENENKELKEKVKRWHDLLLKSDIDSKGIVVDEIENYWDIKAGV